MTSTESTTGTETRDFASLVVRLSAVLRRGLQIRLGCTHPPATQRIAVLLPPAAAKRLPTLRVGRMSHACRDTRAHVVRVRFTRAARRALRQRRRVRLVVQLVTLPADRSRARS